MPLMVDWIQNEFRSCCFNLGLVYSSLISRKKIPGFLDPGIVCVSSHSFCSYIYCPRQLKSVGYICILLLLHSFTLLRRRSMVNGNKLIKHLGAVLELPAKQHCQFSLFTAKIGQMGIIGRAVQLAAPKRPPLSLFFQLPWVRIIHLSSFLLSIECPIF